MSLFILTETSAGYALLKAKDKKLFKHGLPDDASTAEGVSNLYVQTCVLFEESHHALQAACGAGRKSFTADERQC